MIDPMPEPFRLSDQNIIGFVATSDPERAKAFYRDTLGLPLVSDQLPFALVFDIHGIMLRVTAVKQVNPQPYTILGWGVADIATAAAEMSMAGVKFERFPGLEQDANGVWSAPGGAKVAWFKDPDGNTLSISQH